MIDKCQKKQNFRFLALGLSFSRMLAQLHIPCPPYAYLPTEGKGQVSGREGYVQIYTFFRFDLLNP